MGLSSKMDAPNLYNVPGVIEITKLSPLLVFLIDGDTFMKNKKIISC